MMSGTRRGLMAASTAPTLRALSGYMAMATADAGVLHAERPRHLETAQMCTHQEASGALLQHSCQQWLVGDFHRKLRDCGH